MKLYALLIGINEYIRKPLRQCLADVAKMNAYLENIKHHYESVTIETLEDSQATKTNVVNTIKDHFGRATDDDVVLLYFSGHGAQEETNGIFDDEHDGLLECMVCYGEDAMGSESMLANKEIRYLFHKLPNQPHLVSVFDACHSGDIVRAYNENENSDDGITKRIAGVFPAREFQDFIFADDESVISADRKAQKVFIPFKNHMHLAACLSSESSWEDANGGVFTRYLLDLLEATENNLSYLDIVRWAKISMREVTRRKQTPTIRIQGEGSLNATSSWLNLPINKNPFSDGKLINSSKQGWIYDKGSLLGVKKGMEIKVTMEDGEQVSLKVKSTDLDVSKIEVPTSLINELDTSKTYMAETEFTTYSGLKLYVNMIDDEPETMTWLNSFLDAHPDVTLSAMSDADFYINIFNGMLYFSLPENEFQPLAEQLNLSDQDGLETLLKTQLKAFIKWNHFNSLENPALDFQNCPIRVLLKVENKEWEDVTNGQISLFPKQERYNYCLYQMAQIKVENISDEQLYVGLIALGSDMSITANPFNNRVIALKPGESKYLYDHREDKRMGILLEYYQEVYNWKEEWLHYKFIFNNYEDFSDLLNDNDFLQPALEHPRTVETAYRSYEKASAKGEIGDMVEVTKKWGTCNTRIELVNDTYNTITSELKEYWEEYINSEDLAPFIKELYFDEYFNGQNFELRLKQNMHESALEAYRATDSSIVRFLNKLYNKARRRKFRRQKHRDGPLVVAEGDSWFLFPLPGVRDTIDYIMREFRLLSLADAGDEIADYIENNEMLEAVAREKPDFVLISGGGNDILGSEIKEILRSDFGNGASGKDFIKEEVFNSKIEFLRNAYENFFKEIENRHAEAKVLVHGYDFIRSNPDRRTIRRGWANKYMIETGITDHLDRASVIEHLVNTFNSMLSSLCSKEEFKGFVRFVDNRETLEENEWRDEIHPNNVGYEKVASNFLEAMKN